MRKNLLPEIYEIRLVLTRVIFMGDLAGFRTTNPPPLSLFFGETTPSKKRPPIECIVRCSYGLLCEGVIA